MFELIEASKILINRKKLSEKFKECTFIYESEINNMISEIFEMLYLSKSKAEKDIGIYKSSISKMEQAKELIEELKIKEKRKLEKK